MLKSKFEFNIKNYIVTLYNFRIKYNNLFCDLIISNGNVTCDFYAYGNLINFYVLKLYHRRTGV